MRGRAMLAVVCSLAAIVAVAVPAEAGKKPRSCKFKKEDKGCPIRSGGYATRPGETPVLSLTMVLSPTSRATLIVNLDADPCPGGSPVFFRALISKTKKRVTMGASLPMKGSDKIEGEGGVTATITSKGTAKLVSGRKATTKGTATVTFSNGAPPCEVKWSGSMRRV